jgi:heat shock protein HslJ
MTPLIQTLVPARASRLGWATRLALVTGLTLIVGACSDSVGPPVDSVLGPWEVQTIAGEPVLVSHIPGFTLTPEGEIGGNLSCNFFGGSYDYSDAEIRVWDVYQTEMLCSPVPVMEQERAVLDALLHVTTLGLEGRTLIFRDREGTELLTAVAVVDAD